MKHIQKLAPFAAMAVGAVLALATSAFSNAPKKMGGTQTSYKWFQIAGSYGPNDQVDPSDATYLSEGTTAPSGTGCGGSTNQCVSGFTTDQTVTVGGQTLLNGDQKPADVASEKN